MSDRRIDRGTPDERLLPIRAVVAITSWSRTSIYRLVEQGKFPKPVKLGDQRIAFRESQIRAYVASRQPLSIKTEGKSHADHASV